MAIPVKKNLVPSSKYRIKCPYTMTPQFITFHNTANDASAENEIAYMVRNNSSVSYHFAVDDKEVIQGLPLNRNAWHCGDGKGIGSGNRKSIGVEVCYSKSGGPRYVKAEALAIKFIAQLLHERKWGIDRVRPHLFWSNKHCPHRVLTENRWDSILTRINRELSLLKGGVASAPTPVKPSGNQTYKVRPGDTLWAIALAYPGISWEDIKKENGLKNDTISVGQVLKIPGGKVSAPAPKPTPKPTVKYPLDNKVLMYGARGASVTRMQRALCAVYFYPEKGAKNNGVDGSYGSKTQNAVKRFQTVHGLIADGIFGPATRAKLNSLVN